MGESSTPSSRTSESGNTSAATTRKAALEASPGTRTVVPRSGVPPMTLAESPSRSTGTPKAASMRSVWSRLAAGSRTVVRPSACRPASSTAVFTCALATGRSCARPRSRPPVIVMRGLAVRGLDARAHGPQRRRHALERAPLQRGVARERGAERPPGERTGQHPDRRAGVAGVEHGRRRAPALEPARDHELLALLPDRDPQAAQARERRGAVGRAREVAHARLARRPSRRSARRGARWTCRREA